MSDKGGRDHITLPSWLCMGSREKEMISYFLHKTKPISTAFQFM